MEKLSIDIETYSDVDHAKAGVYRYVESPAFEILLFGVSVDGGPVHVYDLACGETLPDEIIDAFVNDTVLKWAYNASFERICISRWLRKAHPAAFCHYAPLGDAIGDYLNPVSWRCSRIWGATLGLPLSLKGIGAVLNLDEQKMTEGAALIRYFCMPCKPTKANGMRTRNLPWQSQEKWAIFKTYNQRDVEVEQAIQQKLAKFPVPDTIWEEYALDQQINDRGIAIDRTLVTQAIALDERARAALMERMKSITHLENPNSVAQMKEWLAAQGAPMESLGKKDVEQAIPTANEPVKTVLGLRLQAAKSSVKKYQAMATAVCADGRARGMFQFYGANRTGRWSGRIIQLQNLRRNSLPDLAEARTLVRDGNFEALELLYDSVPEVLSQLVRTAFIPRRGYKFIVAIFLRLKLACFPTSRVRHGA